MASSESLKALAEAIEASIEAGNLSALEALEASPEAEVAEVARAAVRLARARREQLDSERELNARIIEALPGGLVHVRTDGQILRANDQALAFLGLSYDRLTEAYVADFEPQTLWEDGTPCPVADYPVTRALVTGETQPPATIGVRRPDGTTSWGLFSAVPVKDPASGATTGAVVTILDITRRKAEEEERRRIEAGMQQAQKLESLGVLAGGIAHDFNNLLVAIIGNAGLAMMELPEDLALHEVRECIAHVDRAARRAAELTRQLVAYSGRGQLQTESLDLGRLVGEMGALLEVSVPKQVSVRYALGEGGVVEGDGSQLRQVVLNLITNAAEATEGEGRVEVRTGLRVVPEGELGWLASHRLQGRTYVYLEVEDDGVGMDADTQGRMFDPFFTSKRAGRGLGLAAVLGIVRSHRGGIRVESEPGQGTRVTVLLPRADGPATEEPPPRLASGPMESRDQLVLVVDDEPSVREMAVRALERAGMRVRVATDGLEALAALDALGDEIALVLLDLTMPRLDGVGTLERLRQIAPELPVILSSGYHEQGIGESTGRAGVSFLPKPWGPTELLDAVRARLS